jgi:hypothetical protein
LVKVIITEDKETIDGIIASTNSQNPVSPALLRATDNIQRNLELFFFNSGFYYDRRKNYYKNQGKPASKIFSIQAAAQAIETIIYSTPHTARSQPTSLIKEDATYNRIFNPSKDFKVYLDCCLLVKKISEFCSLISDNDLKNKLANFKLHLARIAASEILGKAQYNLEDLKRLSLGNFDSDLFNNCIAILQESISEYQTENPVANLINMAKTKGLTDKIVEKLINKFTVSTAEEPIETRVI